MLFLSRLKMALRPKRRAEITSGFNYTRTPFEVRTIARISTLQGLEAAYKQVSGQSYNKTLNGGKFRQKDRRSKEHIYTVTRFPVLPRTVVIGEQYIYKLLVENEIPLY